MKVRKLIRRTRGQVIANLLTLGMTYLDAVREYDRLDHADFRRRYHHVYQDDWLSKLGF